MSANTENNDAQAQIVHMLSEALEQARQGRISSALVIATGDNAGGTWARIFSQKGHDALLQRLRELEQWMMQNKTDGSNQ